VWSPQNASVSENGRESNDVSLHRVKVDDEGRRVEILNARTDNHSDFSFRARSRE
jgi:hypothetical protein